MTFICLEDVSVEFPIYSGGSRSLKKLVLHRSTQGNIGRDAHDRISVLALSDINLDIRDGDRLGLLGLNGAGKSTLLKVLAGIYEPTRGRVHSAGRVSALLTASVGLNPELTGRENIKTRGMFMGIHPRDMRGHVDEIVDFTGLGYYIDMPVRTYSSGMVVRLCFTIATAFPPEILLLDEWLAAGDAGFLTKAHQRMEAFVSGSSIVVLASHQLELLQKWCNRALLLDNGRIAAIGTVDEVAECMARSSKLETAELGAAS
jgi:ABC-type polysaccharide/polyol phosphate transport system ATPase subunit